MNKRKLRNTRPQASIGGELAIAGATLAAAGIGMGATLKAAKQQSESIEKNAEQQAAAIEEQNQNNNKLQEKLITNNRIENEKNRQLQQQLQMNLQLLTGQQNTNQMKEAAKIQVKKGGSAKRKLRNAGYANYFLRGNYNNLPFRVTDGGGVIPIMKTPEGYDLYEIIGNDHEHYHKTRGGKNKTGVGITFPTNENDFSIKKFAEDGSTINTIEAEGNQNTNQGEYMLVTPNDAKFISKHNIKGFNPVKAVNAGMHPMNAFNRQEAIKAMYNISDDGKRSTKSPVRKLRYNGGISQDIKLIPDLSLDYLTPVSFALVTDMNKDNKLKCGGRIKKVYGGKPYDLYTNYLTNLTITPSELGSGFSLGNGFGGNSLGVDYNLSSSNTNKVDTTNKPNDSKNPNMTGAYINAGANVIGSLISNLGNDLAARRLGRAYTRAGNIMSNAYANLKGVDTNLLKRNDFRNTHALAAIQAPVVNTGVERTAAKRSMDRAIKNIDEGTVSAAAGQNRIARAETDYADKIANIEDRANKIRQDIIQGNMNRITEISKANAQMDMQSNAAYNEQLANLLKYNSEVRNESILGMADAAATALQQSSSARSAAVQQGLVNIGSAVNVGMSGIGNTLATNAKIKNQLEQILLGADDTAVLRYIYANKNNPTAQRAARGIWLRYRNSNNNDYKQIAADLQNEFNFA